LSILRAIEKQWNDTSSSLSFLLQNRLIYLFKLPDPADLRVFYIGGYWRGANDIVAQMLHGLQKTGANVYEFNTDKNRDALITEDRPYDRGNHGPVWLVKDKVFPHILHFRPHVIICNAGGLSFTPADTATLKKWGIRFLGIALSEPDVYLAATSKIAKNFDAFYSNDKNSVLLHREKGIRCYQLPMATDDSFFYPVQPKPEYECDVLHLGAAHTDRVEAVRSLTEHFNTHVYGESWEKYGIENRGFALGEETLQVLSSAKIVVVFSKTPAGHQIIKPQLFNFLSSGCLVATEDFPDLRQYFEPGKDLIGFKGTDDLLQKIKFYLEHPEEANQLRKAGREKALLYTWDKVWPKLLAHLWGAEN
jgi:hypothetical protein